MPTRCPPIWRFGDFRYQVVHSRLQALQRTLGGNPTDDAIAGFFKLRADDRALLLPVIRKHLLPAMRLPVGWRQKFRPPTLRQLLDSRMNKLHRELNKLPLTPDEKELDVHDAHFLYTKAQAAGKKTNLNMHLPRKDAGTINIRPITLKDAMVLEESLLGLEQSLLRPLRQAFRQNHDPLGDVRAKAIAAKLMEAIAPRVTAIGYSQGGTVLMVALLNYLLSCQRGGFADKPDGIDPKVLLPARSIGLPLLLSAVVKGGIDDLPEWARPLLEAADWVEQKTPMLKERHPGLVGRWAVQLAWWLKTRNSPGIEEMRIGRKLMEKIEKHVDLLDTHGIPVISAFDKHDAYVEPKHSRLSNRYDQTPRLAFNVELQLPIQPPYFETGESLEKAIARLPSRRFPRLRKLSEEWRQRLLEGYMQHFYNRHPSKVEQHLATIKEPEAITKKIGRFLMADPTHQGVLLNPMNRYEPMRYQSMLALSKSFQRRILGKNPSRLSANAPDGYPVWRSIRLLTFFVRQHPGFLKAMIANARENLPFTNSASHLAQDVLKQSLALMAQAVQDPLLRQRYAPIIQASLKTIAAANLPATSLGQQSLSQQAKQLLQQLG